MFPRKYRAAGFLLICRKAKEKEKAGDDEGRKEDGMENGVYQVKIKGTTKVFPEGTTLKEVAEQFQEAYRFPVVLAFVDGKL